MTSVLALLVLLPACDGGGEGARPTASPQPTASVEPTSEPTGEPTSEPAPVGAMLATGEPVPRRCSATTPTSADTVAFVANGRAWALSPDGDALACLFKTPDPGPFAWGPLGDRALLANLEIRGIGEVKSRPPQGFEPPASSWGRPIGESVVFITPDGAGLEKLHVDRSSPTIEDVTPVSNAEYLNVTYHPSGLAFAFAVKQRQEALWLSSNVGEEAREVVFTEVRTKFGALDFTLNGKRLLYAAQHNDDHADLHTIDLTDTSRAPVLWSGPVGTEILDIHAGPRPSDAAFTSGTSCEDAAAMARTREQPDGLELLPDEDRPTQALGWLNDTHVLAAAGGCDEPLDLFTVNVASGSSMPLVFGVDAASVRTPAPSPPPALPEAVPDESGFA